MTPRRVGKSGSYRFEIDWKTIGIRIDRSAETTSLQEYNGLVTMLKQLRKNGQLEVLRRFAEGQLPIAVLKQARRRGRLDSDSLLAELALLERLWHDDARCPQRRDPGAPHTSECEGAVDRLLPRMGKGQTQRRYATSLAKLRRVSAGLVPTRAVVADLEVLDWQALADGWTDSGSDWNHLRRAVSKLLTTLLGHPHHPKRLVVMGRIPLAEENERVPELTVDGFWRIVEATPEHARPCYVVLAATGMRLGEYLRCTQDHLVPEKMAIRVPGTKTKRSRRVVEVGAEAWPWIELGVPSPLRERWLHIYWWRACVATGYGRYEPVLDAAGRPLMKTVVERVAVPGQRRKARVEKTVPRQRYEGLRIHDLRHVTGQVATDEGASLSQVGDALGQSDPKITARYTRRHNAAVAGRKVSSALFQRRAG